MDTTVGSGNVVRSGRSWFQRTFVTPRAARITAPVLFLVAWQLRLVDLVLGLFFPDRSGSALLPTPTEVVEAMWEQLLDGTLVAAFSVSLVRLAGGFALALVVGSVVGLAMGLSPRIEAMLHDFVIVGLTFPYLIWGLLVAMWWGFAWYGPVLVVVIAGLPYVILNMSEGVRDVSKELRDMAAAYEVPRDRVMRNLILPSLSPFFFASLRYGMANGWKGLILAEVFAATSGAGWHITSMRDYGDFAGVVGFAIYFALFSIVVERLVFGRLSRRVFRWRPGTGREVSEPPELAAP
jgi:ABC-type nitrate/sulfonate/bicarbonate transport system permease component